jgi:hypothetical protein
MISRGRHPRNDIANALRRAEEAGLEITVIHRGHRWGEVICVRCQAGLGIWSTPRNAGTHAKQIDRFTQNHTHVAPPVQPSTAR